MHLYVSICTQRFNAYKYHWSDKQVPVILEVNAASVDQVDPATRRTLCSYSYKDIEGFAVVCLQFALNSLPLMASVDEVFVIVGAL